MSLLRVAVPNKGSLSQSASEILRESGYRQRDDSKQLTLIDDENGVEFFYLRPRDIALYVGEGTLDVGITGRDLLLDSGAQAHEVRSLGFGRSRFRFAGPAGRYTDLAELAGLRIATSYVGVVGAFLAERGIEASVVRLDGAVETSIQLGVADVVADVVETGSTLRQAGLEVFGETILESEAVLVTRGGAEPPAGFEVFKRRLDGVLVARSYVMMDYDIESQHVSAAVALTPGIESPTVSPLHKDGWVAVRAMVPRAGAQRLMDELWTIGARGILLTDIHACRL
ncbi:ATP phosphoribosyltransferase [Nocardioides marmotae]|uniref:ATP phosphoribosyltransferase n=1 Tax=Nocardioides marmotae TaxID=2663857 RepID=A0A6I3JH58_9ACTN|nr:ATP phosphoribosyltransferase [Nocardioides marmotae]MCR6033704.1 ATP phosphoribosyltransferase [Gordonia jinghuaiqii]MBC9735126.1 ATP phosphoribosyltransferase [Nocardioides marmotae]MTB86226.1 ATP phosphoribosyltransferase [Nocardioides marmotae]MTB97362.1 ATP phosphoribosyltransferase [Nocardioides marmotae]QKE01701.1 ATP phosphoribosyltransferase [Nocardioides marmotae]